jgi:hypothetical protein
VGETVLKTVDLVKIGGLSRKGVIIVDQDLIIVDRRKAIIGGLVHSKIANLVQSKRLNRKVRRLKQMGKMQRQNHSKRSLKRNLNLVLHAREVDQKPLQHLKPCFTSALYCSLRLA